MQMQGQKQASEIPRFYEPGKVVASRALGNEVTSLDLCSTTDDYNKYVNRIVNNHNITTDTLYEIVSIIKQLYEYGYNCTHKHNFHTRVLYATIIILELFNSEVDESVIDEVYRNIGRQKLKYNDNDYVDDVIDSMENFEIDEKCLPLILIANALCGISIFN